MDDISRRSLLKAAGSAGIIGGIPETAMAFEPQTASGSAQETMPKHTIKFAVIGLDHNHINGITEAIRRGGGELVAVHSAHAETVAAFQKHYDGVAARSEEEILNDPSIQLVCSASIPNQRAPLGVRVMRHGKDFLVDKPAITTLEQLGEVRRAVQETGRIFGIMYGRLESRATLHAGSLVRDGAIGEVIQTIQLAPHLINEKTRPEWFWEPTLYGGTLCDLGSHQADEFVYFTGSKTADVVWSQVANVHHPHRPKFQDFGDMVIHGDRGRGYFRVDWFTPATLGVFGDERTFILGTDGYIEMRKTIDITGRPGGDHVFIVNQKGARYIDCKNLPLPFGAEFVADVANRTHVAQDQAAALLASELCLKGQKNARVL